VWLVSRKKIFGQALGCIWAGIFILVIGVSIIHFFKEQMELSREDIYGEYIIDRTKFSGKQADWQYNHYRFEITPDDKVLFHVTEGKQIVKTYTGTLEFLQAYKSPRIVLHFEKSSHHIIAENPTLYKNTSPFYYVFYSKKFNNVFFTQGKWKPIE
jgi:hypothetical protein